MSTMPIEQRLKVLEDIEDIRKLKAAYCKACDNDHHPKEVIELFVKDGIWETGGIGKFEGLDAINEFMADLRASGRIRNSAHNVFNPTIEVDGNSATGHWRLLMLYTANTTAGDIEYFRIIGRYEEKYSREIDGWKFKHLHCYVEEHAEYSVNED